MLSAFAQAFRTPDLRKKLLFTLGIIVVYRFGASLPAPGISTANVRYCSGLATAHPGAAADLYAMLNLFSGGSLLHIATGIQRLADAKLMAASPELAEALLRLLTSPDLMTDDLDPQTRARIAIAWDLLVRAAPHLEI